MLARGLLVKVWIGSRVGICGVYFCDVGIIGQKNGLRRFCFFLDGSRCGIQKRDVYYLRLLEDFFDDFLLFLAEAVAFFEAFLALEAVACFLRGPYFWLLS